MLEMKLTGQWPNNVVTLVSRKPSTILVNFSHWLIN